LNIRKWTGAPASDDQSDGQLLERFLAQRDQTAFATLVERHSAMVLSVCRRLLRDPHEAEDAFQATFLVLVRKARSIVCRESVGSWLYGVAYRLALRSRTLAERRQKQDSEVEDVPAPDTRPAGAWHELRPVLDEEINRLPEKYRQPVVLCYFEGKPYEEAARLLGWPAGTVSGRLARARDILRRRLTRRGVVLASSLPATLLADQRVSAELLATTVRAAFHYAAGPEAAAGSVPASAAALAEGLIHSMSVHKLKLGAVVLAALLMLGAGIAVFSLRAHAGKAPVADNTLPEVAVKDGILPKGDRQGEVVAVQFAHDGQTVFVARAGSVVGYHATTYEPANRFGHPASTDSGSVVVYDTTTHEERGEILTDRRFGFRRIALSPDWQMAVIDLTYSARDGVMLFSLVTKKEMGLEGAPRQLSGLAFAPDGKTVACAAWWRDDKTGGVQRTAVQLWDVGTPKLRTTLEGIGVPASGSREFLWSGSNGLAFSPDGRFLSTAGITPDQQSGFVKVWDIGTGAVAATLTDKDFSPRQLTFSPDGKKLLVCTNQGIQLWDVAGRKRDWTYPGENDKTQFMDVGTLAYSPDGKLVATGDYSGLARVWDAATGEERDRCKVTEAYVTSLAFAPDSQSLVIGSGHYFNDRRTKLKFDGYPARVWKLKK